MGPDEIASTVCLPDDLKDKPYLREFYGKVSWSVRAYFAGTLGWFDGNPTNLSKLSPQQSAERTIRMTGGADKLLAEAQRAAKDNDHQWVLELSDYLVAAEAHTHAAIQLKIASLRALADTEINATGRNYYCLLYTSPSPRDKRQSRMPSSA